MVTVIVELVSRRQCEQNLYGMCEIIYRLYIKMVERIKNK